MRINYTKRNCQPCFYGNYSDEILLEVDSENNSAYMLYTTSGFRVRTQYDYYPCSTEDVCEASSS